MPCKIIEKDGCVIVVCSRSPKMSVKTKKELDEVMEKPTKDLESERAKDNVHPTRKK